VTHTVTRQLVYRGNGTV